MLKNIIKNLNKLIVSENSDFTSFQIFKNFFLNSKIAKLRSSRDAVKFNSGEEYAYIYNLKDKKWYYKSRYSNPQDWTELK